MCSIVSNFQMAFGICISDMVQEMCLWNEASREEIHHEEWNTMLINITTNCFSFQNEFHIIKMTGIALSGIVHILTKMDNSKQNVTSLKNQTTTNQNRTNSLRHHDNLQWRHLLFSLWVCWAKTGRMVSSQDHEGPGIPFHNDWLLQERLVTRNRLQISFSSMGSLEYALHLLNKALCYHQAMCSGFRSKAYQQVRRGWSIANCMSASVSVLDQLEEIAHPQRDLLFNEMKIGLNKWIHHDVAYTVILLWICCPFLQLQLSVVFL